MRDLHKTGVVELIHYQFWTNGVCYISWIFFRIVNSLVPVFVSFTVNAILLILTILLFKILCCQTAAVHQWMVMLDEWNEDNELAPLEPAMERACSTSTSLPLVPLVAILVERLPKCCSKKNEKDPPVPRRQIDERIRLWSLLPNSERRKAGFREVSCVFLYLIL